MYSSHVSVGKSQWYLILVRRNRFRYIQTRMKRENQEKRSIVVDVIEKDRGLKF